MAWTQGTTAVLSPAGRPPILNSYFLKRGLCVEHLSAVNYILFALQLLWSRIQEHLQLRQMDMVEAEELAKAIQTMTSHEELPSKLRSHVLIIQGHTGVLSLCPSHPPTSS